MSKSAPYVEVGQIVLWAYGAQHAKIGWWTPALFTRAQDDSARVSLFLMPNGQYSSGETKEMVYHEGDPRVANPDLSFDGIWRHTDMTMAMYAILQSESG